MIKTLNMRDTIGLLPFIYLCKYRGQPSQQIAKYLNNFHRIFQICIAIS